MKNPQTSVVDAVSGTEPGQRHASRPTRPLQFHCGDVWQELVALTNLRTPVRWFRNQSWGPAVRVRYAQVGCDGGSHRIGQLVQLELLFPPTVDYIAKAVWCVLEVSALLQPSPSYSFDGRGGGRFNSPLPSHELDQAIGQPVCGAGFDVCRAHFD